MGLHYDDDERDGQHEAHLRRLGAGREPRCQYCGERRPEALLRVGDLVVCRECAKRQQRNSDVEMHHLAGKANDALTLPLSCNDHAAVSDLQRLWPQNTLRNPDESPLLRFAAFLRGLLDLLAMAVEKLAPLPEEIEELDKQMRAVDGPRYWELPEPEDSDGRR